LEKIIKVFEGEEIHLDPAMQAEISGSPIRQNPSLAKPSPQSSSLVKRGEGRFSDKTRLRLTLAVIQRKPTTLGAHCRELRKGEIMSNIPVPFFDFFK
jgi:hypothetical protein